VAGKASQAGNAVYSPAPEVTQSFAVAAVGPQVFFGKLGGADALAASVAQDSKGGTLLGFLSATGQGFVFNFTLNASGGFVATTTPMSCSAVSSSPATHPRRC